MFKVAVAHSIELDSADAARDVLAQCRDQLEELKPQAGIMFAGIDHDFKLVLKEICATYPDIELIGCTTDGEMSSVHGYADDSVVLMAFCSDALVFKAGMAEHVFQDTAKSVRTAVAPVISGMAQAPTLCIATPTGLTPIHTPVDGDSMLEGLKLALGEDCAIFGGAAGDQWTWRGTYQFYRDLIRTDALPFLLISGPLLYSFGVETGRIPIGPKERVTRSSKNIVYEIGDKPATDFYKHYLGEGVGIQDKLITEYALAVFEDDTDRFYIRAGAIADGDLDKGILTFAGDVPEHAIVQLTHASRDVIVESAERSVAACHASYPGSEPVTALCFSCTSRKQLLGTRVTEEYRAFERSFPDLPVAGFYCYGEFAPLGRGKPARFHNETFVNLVMGVK